MALVKFYLTKAMIKMNNELFIKKYGIVEFKRLKKDIINKLEIEKLKRNIRGYKILKKNKSAKIYLKNKEEIILDFANIFFLDFK